MVGAGINVFAVWGYIITKCRRGWIEINPKLLAFTLGGTEEEILSALEFLQKPDPESRSKEEDGRRLVRDGQFQYRIVNWEKYDQIKNAVERREYMREKQAEFRARQKFDGKVKPPKTPKKAPEPPVTAPETEVSSPQVENLPPPPPIPPKLPPSSEHQAFIDGFTQNFEAEFGMKYAWQGRDPLATQKLLKMGILRLDLLEMAKQAWARAKSDPYCVGCKKASTIHEFYENINRIQQELKNGTNRNPSANRDEKPIVPVKGSVAVGGF